MKQVKRIGLGILSLPFALLTFIVLFEIFGMCVNHMATHIQTGRLRADLEREIPDIVIIDVYSETGNTSGTGNHVDCLSAITFSTELSESEIKSRLSNNDEYNEWGRLENQTGEGEFRFCFITSAPFPDNIEGH